jgi:predicted nucleic acid-binding protein
MIVVADTGPVNYLNLILSGHVVLVHELYGALLIPTAVHRELLDPRAPLKVREWANALPVWAEVRQAADTSRFADLGPGEREAISPLRWKRRPILFSLTKQWAGRLLSKIMSLSKALWESLKKLLIGDLSTCPK